MGITSIELQPNALSFSMVSKNKFFWAHYMDCDQFYRLPQAAIRLGFQNGQQGLNLALSKAFGRV